MKISYNWLKDFIKTDISLEEITETLTDIGLEVEGTESKGISAADLENFVVGEVLTCEQHPNADKLSLTTVDLGDETVQIVCGAPNVRAGQKVPVARQGAVINDGKGNIFTIKKAKLRGEESNGMICSKKELRLSEDHSGIWEMDTELTAGTPLSEVIDTENDVMIEIGLTPNRADAMSHFGVARDLYAALKFRNMPAEFIAPDFPEIPKDDNSSAVTVEIEDRENCLRYAGILMENVKVKPSPVWLQNRLKTIGLTPKNNIVDITNYILHSYGQPLHAFDADKISGGKIIVKSGEFKGESFSTLDKTERKLLGNELLICDTEKPLAIAGVMGGLNSAVTDSTTNIFIESALFDPVSVRKTSKNHNINSDSSFRFERGVDPEFTVKALQLAVNMVEDLAGGRVNGNVIDHYPSPVPPHKATLDLIKVQRLLGAEIPQDKVKEILQLLEIKVVEEDQNELKLEIPAYRVDVQREADLVEEILRIYGFNTVENPGKMSFALVSGKEFRDYDTENQLADIIAAHGFNEAMNLSMHKKQYTEWLQTDEKSVEILNSLSADLAVMRQSLLPGLLENVDFNLKRKQENIKLFELGNIYSKKEAGFEEKKVLGIILSGNMTAENWQSQQEKASVSHLKGILQLIFGKFGMQKVQTSETSNSFGAKGISFNFSDVEVAVLYKIPSEFLKKFDIQQEVMYAEIYLPEFRKAQNELKRTRFRELSRFPEVRRDLALLLDKSRTYQEVENLVLKTDENLIKKVNLFDVYEGDKLPANMKSYAVSLYLQDEEKTMNDAQIDAVMQKVIKNLEKGIGAQLRN